MDAGPKGRDVGTPSGVCALRRRLCGFSFVSLSLSVSFSIYLYLSLYFFFFYIKRNSFYVARSVVVCFSVLLMLADDDAVGIAY